MGKGKSISDPNRERLRRVCAESAMTRLVGPHEYDVPSSVGVWTDQLERLVKLARDGKKYRRLIAESKAIGPSPARGNK